MGGEETLFLSCYDGIIFKKKVLSDECFVKMTLAGIILGGNKSTSSSHNVHSQL